MKVVIRVDASVWIGSGHVMRCLVLADALKKQNHRVLFASLPQQGDMIAYIMERGFEVIELNPPETESIPEHDADYACWLQRPVRDDAEDFIQKVKAADLIVTDHYAIGSEWQSYVKATLGCKLLAVDDLVRSHTADVIVDQTLGRKPNEYVSGKRVLAGSQYALLNARFTQAREKALQRACDPKKPKVLVSMGGIDRPNATLSVLKVLVQHVDAEFTVLLSPRAPHYEKVVSWCSGHNNVVHKDFVSNMADLMLKHDIAIGAPGTTSWERACLGLPSIIIPLAENQRMICEQLVANRAAIAISLEQIQTDLIVSYQKLINNWESYHQANLRLCDGRGTNRVVLEIQQLISEDLSSQLELVSATHEDIRLIYDWQCHPQTRKYALNPEPPSWVEHQRWMSDKLESCEDYFYLVRNKTSHICLGALRLDRIKPGHYLVSIFVAPDSYGRGIATSALNMVDIIHPDVTLHATVLSENIASQRLFEKANFTRTGIDSFVRNPML